MCVEVKARATKRQSPLVHQKEAEAKAAKRHSPLVRQEAEAKAAKPLMRQKEADAKACARQRSASHPLCDKRRLKPTTCGAMAAKPLVRQEADAKAAKHQSPLVRQTDAKRQSPLVRQEAEAKAAKPLVRQKKVRPRQQGAKSETVEEKEERRKKDAESRKQ